MNQGLNKSFTEPLLNWYALYGRKNLPWQHPRNAYSVWISEIMLQQTQVQTVIPYFQRFMHSFPDIKQLSSASLDAVLAHWSGLGYYSRARNIHKTAQIIQDQYDGKFPKHVSELILLPGIGASTAAAIASLAFHQATAILDANVKRVLSRYFMVEGLGSQAHVNKNLWDLAHQCMSKIQCADYTQAIMDLGATLCTNKNPDCPHCPLHTTCLAYQNNQVSLYPFKKEKKIRPIKKQQFLLLYRENTDIYLQKNPPVGLWGGLWCMPALELEADITAFVAQHFHSKCLTICKLMDMKHSFSHFHLEICAMAVQIQANSFCVAENSGRWFNRMNLQNVGLAKPINHLIDYFYQNRG